MVYNTSSWSNILNLCYKHSFSVHHGNHGSISLVIGYAWGKILNFPNIAKLVLVKEKWKIFPNSYHDTTLNILIMTLLTCRYGNYPTNVDHSKNSRRGLGVNHNDSDNGLRGHISRPAKY